MERYFFSKIARGLKFGMSAIAALACGTVIVCGALGISTVAVPISGGIALIPAILILIENTKLIADLEKNIGVLKEQIKEFSNQLDNLKTLNKEFENENKKFVVSNQQLEFLLNEAKGKIDDLNLNLEEYKQANKRFSKNLKEAEESNDNLRINIESLISIKQSYEIKIHELNSVVGSIEKQLLEVTKIKEDYEEQLTSYENVTRELQEELKKVRNMYSKSKEVITTLLQTKEIFEDVAKDMVSTLSDMGTTELKTQDNVDKMTGLIDKFEEERTKDMFQQLDKNEDGKISLDEFIEGYN